MIESENETKWNTMKLLLQDNNSQPSMTDYEILLLENKVRSLVPAVVKEWYTEAGHGNRMYMRRCSVCLTFRRMEERNRDGNRDRNYVNIRENQIKSGMVKSARSSLVSTNTESKCRVFGCNCIITEEESDKFELRYQMCVTCFVTEKKKLIDYNFKSSHEEKKS